MSEMSREELLAVVREVYDDADPVPSDLVSRIQASLAARTLDEELLMLVEQELAGARGTTYTLRFASDDLDVLLRIAADGESSRIDGWVVPAEPMTVRVLQGSALAQAVVLSDSGRFELTGLQGGLHRIRLEPHAADRAPFATPTFEI